MDCYEEVNKYARQQERERCLCEEKQIREWFAAELDNKNCLKIESEDLIKYIIREVQILKTIFLNFDIQINELDKIERLWDDFLLYNLNLFLEYFMTKDKRKVFILEFSEKVSFLKIEAAENFIHNYNEYNHRYTKYMMENFSLEKNADKHFWRLICYMAKTSQVEQYIKEYRKFLFFYVFYLCLKIPTEDFNSCKKELNKCRIALMELVRNKKYGRIQLPDLKKIKNPLYCSNGQKCLQDITYYMKVILFCWNKKIYDREGVFEMIEELYRQIREKIIVFDDLKTIVPEEINRDICTGKLPEFHNHDFGVLQENEKVHYFNHTVLYQGKNYNEDTKFDSYKGLLIFTDKRIIFKGKYILDLGYEDICRITQYDTMPEILEIQSGNKINYFYLPSAEVAYKILKLIANCHKGEEVIKKQISLSYEELLEKADTKAYIFAFEYMASSDLPKKLKEMLLELTCRLRELQKITEKNMQYKEDIYHFLHYYIPETVKLILDYQSYQGIGMADEMIREVYKKVETAVYALSGAVSKKVLEIYQTSARNTMAGADALKEILGQDGYVDSAYTMKK